eukprot:TRINITY_DN22513_c0_g1_i1.p1 TRINITY_DN22513_c0_g1~~TRINITY_DN22513_c0_g1_i1.p1  ORF type:complete len:194 (+),score=54.93 TRINITY_DN22513_c0_g1_i1:67-648(+)
MSEHAAPSGDAPSGVNVDLIFNTVLVLLVAVVLAWKAWENQQHAKKKRGGNDDDDSRIRCDSAAKPEEQEEVSDHELGEEMEMPVESLHFGLPRVCIMFKGSEPLSKMLKWPEEQFCTLQVDVARIRIGTFKCWVAQGMASNRLLYAMKKRGDVATCRCSIVATPEQRRSAEDDDDEFPETHGPDYTKLQLIP